MKKLPKLKTPKALKTREFLLDSAARVIAKEGIDRANLARIAKEAKTVPSHLSHYFPRSGEIPLHVIRHIYAKLYTGVEKKKLEVDPELALEGIVKENYAYFEKNPHEYSVIVLSYYYAHIHKELRSFLGKIYSDNIEHTLEILRKLNIIANEIRSDQELRGFAESFIYELEGGLIYYFSSAHNKNYEKFVENQIDALRFRLKLFFSHSSS